MMIDPDYSLIDRILSGEQHIYALLVDKHKKYAFTLAVKILQNKHEAEEAAQDAFVKAFHNLRMFNREAKFSTWFYRIVFNTAISYKRKQRHQFQSLENTIIKHPQDAEGALEKQDKKKYLDEALALLMEADRTALTLFYLQEFSLDEIAIITGIPANTIKVRIHRARLRLAEELKQLLKKEALSL